MVWSKEGFLPPEVETQACINCGACVKACPAQPGHQPKQQTTALETPAAYGGWHADKNTHLASSSGGVFTALADEVFAAGGCVFGVIWENKDTARFSKAENKEELAAMRGSKYTQAIPGMVYREVREELKKERRVLFCGTACQVYALRQYLRKDYENLLLVDILCHGVPSRNLLVGYIREWEHQEGKSMERIRFRDKANGWQNYQVTKIFTDGSTLSHCNKEDMFIRLFIGDMALNRACYSCPHARFPRTGDITLGDFWGNLQLMHPDWPIREGIGSLLANTDKGKRILQELEEAGHPEPVENLLQGQRTTYLRQAPVPAKRESTLKRLKTESIPRLYNELCLRVQCGSFSFRKNGLMHRAYNKLRRMKNKLMSGASQEKH